MKSEVLMNAIGEIRDEYILEADFENERYRKKRHWGAYCSPGGLSERKLRKWSRPKNYAAVYRRNEKTLRRCFGCAALAVFLCVVITIISFQIFPIKHENDPPNPQCYTGKESFIAVVVDADKDCILVADKLDLSMHPSVNLLYQINSNSIIEIPSAELTSGEQILIEYEGTFSPKGPNNIDTYILHGYAAISLVDEQGNPIGN